MKKFLHVLADVAKKAASVALSARCVGGKLKAHLAPTLLGVMIVSGSVALLSCVGWLVARKAR